MALTDKMIAIFKSNWKMFNPNVTEEYLQKRIDRINEEHAHMEELKSKGYYKTSSTNNPMPGEEKGSMIQSSFTYWMFMMILALSVVFAVMDHMATS